MRLSLRGSKNWASTPRQPPPPLPAPMTHTEFRVLCAKLKIDGNEIAGELLGISWRTAQRYWYDEQSPPEPLARLLRICANLKLDHQRVRELTTRQGKPTAV